MMVAMAAAASAVGAVAGAVPSTLRAPPAVAQHLAFSPAATCQGSVAQGLRSPRLSSSPLPCSESLTGFRRRQVGGGGGPLPLSPVSAGLRFCAQRRQQRRGRHSSWWPAVRTPPLNPSADSSPCISSSCGSRHVLWGPRHTDTAAAAAAAAATCIERGRYTNTSQHCLFIFQEYSFFHQSNNISPRNGYRKPVGGRRTAATSASWGAQVEFREAPIARVEEVAEQLWGLTVDVSRHEEIGKGYIKPGQYVQMKVGDSKPAFLAIASPPSYAEKGVLEFLIKNVEGSTAQLLCQLSQGDKVGLSPVMGKGFNLDLISPSEDYPSVVIFATGSGISPIRAVIESGFDALNRTDVRLYYGARNAARMAYQQKFESWKAMGVEVVPVFSEPEEGWDGAVGYVQHAYKKDDPIEDPIKAGALLCGQKAMTEDVIALLTGEGVSRERILMNF